jgi:hypothetical protein
MVLSLTPIWRRCLVDLIEHSHQNRKYANEDRGNVYDERVHQKSPNLSYPSCVADTGLNPMENTYKIKPR